MKFTSTLIKGKLIKRYKRFFVDIKVNNKILTAHCPNTGSMMGLLDQGNEAWISEHNDPKRKLKFTLEMIKVKKRIIGVNTHSANRIVEHALKNKLIHEFKKVKLIKPEFNTPVEAVIIHALALIVPRLVSILRIGPDQFISFTIVFKLTGRFFL